jgi:uncharacterized membrane protein YbaN (DUF454 family)
MASLPPDQKLSKRRVGAAITRPTFFVLGLVFLVIGVAGVALPLLPGTIFLILAAACFTRSSPRFEKWLLEHPVLGPPIVKWRETGAISSKVKWIACISMAISWLIVLGSEAPWLAKAAFLPLFVAGAIYVVSRPEA